MRFLVATFIWLALALGPTPAAFAQSSVTPLEVAFTAPPPSGWSFTPALDYAFVWDSNVLMENVGSTIVGEQLHVLKPRGSLGFVGRRGDLAVHYNGAFVQHADLTSLNSYDQRLTVNATRLLSRRTSLFLHSGTIIAPTTELVELVGVPFTRIGSRRQDVRTGILTQLSRKAELTGTYRFQWVDFEQDPNAVTVLNGGQGHGGTLGLKYAVTDRLDLTAEYDITRAAMASGETFAVQNTWSGVEYQFNENTRAFGSAGASHLAAMDGRPSRLGPAVRVGVARNVRDALLSVAYSRSYVPSYGFGGTTDNEELTTQAQIPITQRLLAYTALSLRRNEPLETATLALRSMWFHGSIGYLLADWARVEAFAAGSRQDIDRPDGRVNRYTFGLQLTAATTARIR